MLSVRPILLRLCSKCQLTKTFHSSPTLSVTYSDPDPTYGYGKIDPKREVTLKEKINMLRDGGISDVKKQVERWTDEVKDKMYMDPRVDVYPHEPDIVWKFNESTIDNWTVSCDSDHNEGASTGKLSVSALGHGMFSGAVNTLLPKDGKMKRTGYVNLKSHRHTKSFEREDCFEWPMFTHLIIKCRGDGRSYMLNLHTPGEFDLSWGDMYTYILYTRGGPYWQVSKIPFSKFFFQSKGRNQDLQEPLPIDRVSSLGLTMCDSNNGPFQLEIDYIGVVYDPSHQETFAYEMYLFENEVRGIVHW